MSRSSLTEFALANPLYVWVIVLTCLIGGLAGGQRIAQLEDPPYPIKIAYVFTEYPGASTLDVELEVTEVLERSIQELPWIENIVSRSLPGRSEIEIELNHSVSASNTGQIWDELRRRVAEAAMRLPAGTSPPWVEDDFSDVYGLLYGFTIPHGYDIATIRDAARLLETEIKRVEHVAKVRVEGVPEEQVQIDFDYAQLRQLGVPFYRIVEAINSASGLFPASMMESGDQRMRIDIPLERSEAVLEELLIALPGETSMIRLGDVASVSREETNLPSLIVRHEGQRIFALGIAINETQNVVRVGKVVETRLLELQQLLPVGIEMIPLFEQHRLVDRSIGQFLLNLTASYHHGHRRAMSVYGLARRRDGGRSAVTDRHRHRRRDGRYRDRATTDFAGRHDDRDGHAGRQCHRGDRGHDHPHQTGSQPPGVGHRSGGHDALPSACGHGYRDCRLCPHWPVE
jgi:multidrug efflux pump subunit AcrB